MNHLIRGIAYPGLRSVSVAGYTIEDKKPWDKVSFQPIRPVKGLKIDFIPCFSELMCSP
jgi:N-acetylneuraminic acid mutarotase